MSSNDDKRNRKIELSNEAEVLKKMREVRSLSVRNVGEMLNISFTTVSYMENGRATIHDKYLNNFLIALEFFTKQILRNIWMEGEKVKH